MNQRYEATPTPESSTQSARILDYHVLVDAVQLSTARVLDIDGTQQAHNFDKGVDGVLPWQPKLEQHIEALRKSGTLRKADVQVERYASSDIESLTRQAQALALETAPII